MFIKNKSYFIMELLLVAILFFFSCVEPYEISSISYVNTLVVEANITNENKLHTVTLSRTYEIDSVRTTLIPEEGAKVKITDDTQITYNFIEQEKGVYQSENNFAAEENKKYVLSITDSNGKGYMSNEVSLTSISEITDVNYEVVNNDLGETIVNFRVNSFNPENNSNYYAYEYEETYLAYASKWTVEQFDLTSYPPVVSTVIKDYDHSICYKTEYSNDILQAETLSLNEDRIDNLIVRSIYTDDIILAERYSILVKQHVQSLNAYNYYQNLKLFSEPSDVFSGTQVGFIEGNLYSKENLNENVIGFFEVSSVSSKRIFIDREDVTEDVYNYNCVPIAPMLYESFGDIPPLIEFLDLNEYIFLSSNDPPPPVDFPGPYFLTPIECGDCTASGSIEKPSFWID